MFFVVSTGRSGSMSIAHLLDQSPDCYCVHEPEPVLIAEATQYLYGELDTDSLRQLLRETRQPITEGKQYGESNHKLSNIIPVLRETFPDAKFIWLIRDARDFVASAYARPWYDQRRMTRQDIEWEWELWRICGDRVADMSRRKWLKMSRFSKVCWYWSFRNRLIEKELQATNADYLFVRLEELNEHYEQIIAFLGLERSPEPKFKALNTANKRHQVQRWHTWTQQQRYNFSQICGAEMQRWYPDETFEADIWHTKPSLPQRIRSEMVNELRYWLNPENLPGVYDARKRPEWLHSVIKYTPSPMKRYLRNKIDKNLV